MDIKEVPPTCFATSLYYLQEQKVSDLKLIGSRPGILGFLKYYTFCETCRSYVFNILLYIYIYVCIYIYIYIYI